MRVSVVVPLYNGERYLAAALDSIVAQSVPPAEIFVIDDGSSDGGPAIAERYAGRVTLLRQSQNGGVQAARNIGIAKATGDWIAFCDQDDLWSPDYLAEAARLLRAAPGLELIFANFHILRADGRIDAVTKFDTAPADWWTRAGRRVLPEGWVFEHSLAALTFDWQPIFPSGEMVSRRLLDRVGVFDTRMRGLRPEDWEFTLRSLYHAKVGALHRPVVTIRKHGENFSANVGRILADEVVLLSFIKRHHAEAAPLVPVIEREIRRRRIAAMESAFEERDHARAGALWRDISRKDRSGKLAFKGLCLALPDALGLPLNRMLQAASSIHRKLR